MLDAPAITYVYDDFTENLLTQYQQQLQLYEQMFFDSYGHLPPNVYAELRDQDDMILAILDVVAKIYEQAVPIAIILQDDKKPEPKDESVKAH